MRFVAILCALSAAIFLQRITARADEAPEEPTPRVRFHLDVGWPEGITYDVGTFNPELDEVEPLGWFEDVYLTGRVGARLDLDAAAFVTDDSLPDFDGGVEVRRLRFYLTGDFRLGVPLAYNFEFSVEGSRVFLNGFSLRYKPDRWLDAVDVGYLTPPMGLDNVVSSRARTLMEVAAPVQALAPGYRSGLALAGHWTPWLLAWKLGFYSVGQAQLNGDASDTNAQVVGRLAWLPWRASDDPGAAFLHLGASASYAFSGDAQIRYRARPESFVAPFVVDTGDMPGTSAFQYGLEAAWRSGALLLSGEVLESYVEGEGDRDNTNFGGFYGLASWVVTGETHPYDTTTGLFQRLVPARPFSLTDRTWGAVEVGQRVSFIDLSDGPVRGGELLTLSSGITWHLNAELRLFANYVFAHVTTTPERGDANIFQARIEIGI